MLFPFTTRPRPPCPPRCPYTTLFRSRGVLKVGIDSGNVTVEPPRDPSHGDMATNAAMVLAKPAGVKPRELAEALVDRKSTRLNSSHVAISYAVFCLKKKKVDI